MNTNEKHLNKQPVINFIYLFIYFKNAFKLEFPANFFEGQFATPLNLLLCQKLANLPFLKNIS